MYCSAQRKTTARIRINHLNVCDQPVKDNCGYDGEPRQMTGSGAKPPAGNETIDGRRP